MSELDHSTMLDAFSLPPEILESARAVLWNRELRGGKQTKVPYQVNRPTARAAVDDPNTWGEFEQALVEVESGKADGAGIVLGDGKSGIDLDHCRNPQTGVIDSWARCIIEEIDSYTEVSPSGEGIHILVSGMLPPGRRRKGKIEMYCDGRYFTVTGNHIAGTPTTIEERTSQLAAVHARVFPSASNGNGKGKTPPPNLPPSQPEDANLIAHAKRAKNGPKFSALWEGDTSEYPTHSEADLALAGHLAFWTVGNADRIDRLFRQSGLMRSKWDERRGEKSYGDRTIETAIASCGQFYSANGTAAEPALGAGSKAEPQTLAKVVAVFQKRLHLPDPTALHVMFGTIAANRMNGDPVWLLIVGAPGSGKTEILGSLNRLPNMHPISTLTEAALLSGSPRRETTKGSTGGKLRDMGDFGFLILKDFTSLLSMQRDTRAAVLAALREIYDGQWVRLIGNDGGRELRWRGKVALLAGCTPTIDGHHAVISAMGERFIFVRLPTDDATAQGEKALDHLDNEATMRAELASAVVGLFAGITIPKEPPPLAKEDKKRLVALASLAVRCRSAVERDRYRREIELVPAPEAPTRLALTLARLLAGMDLIGVEKSKAWDAVEAVALDSMPQLRRDVFNVLRDGESLDTTTIAGSLGYPTVTTRRACEDLTAHGVLTRLSSGQGIADRWYLSEWTVATLSAMSESTI